MFGYYELSECIALDGKQKNPNDDLKKSKIPIGEVRDLRPFSSGFLSLSLSFLLKLPAVICLRRQPQPDCNNASIQ